MNADECLQRLSHIDFERSNIRDRFALHFAMDFITKRRWRKLSEEKPTKEGQYLVWQTAYDEAAESWWNGTSFDEDPVTHWAFIDPPEVEDDPK